MKKESSQRCTKCVLPESVPGIRFNDEGVCNFCQNLEPQIPFGRLALEKIVDSIRNKGPKYDCIVPLSGGRDSSFVLHFVAIELGLRVLAVNYDNEFRVDQALTNMKKATKSLGVDFVTTGSAKNYASKVVLNGVRSSLRSGLSWTAGDACRSCMYGYHALVYRTAIKHEIPLILWGQSSFEATQDMEAEATAPFHHSRLSKMSSPSFYLAELYALLHRNEYKVPGNSILSRKGIPKLYHSGIKEALLFDYIQWDRKEMKEVIMNKLGWETPKESTSTWRIDCSLHSLVNYCYNELLGCTKDCFGYTKIIFAGQISREKALEQEKSALKMIYEHIDDLFLDIGLTKEEIVQAKNVLRTGICQ